MRQTFNMASLGLLLALLVILGVCSASIESRATPASPTPRKPPFNGSIFGKRSSLSALDGIMRSYRTATSNSAPDGPTNINQQLAALEVMAQEQHQLQRDAIIRASINQCLVEKQQNTAPDVEATLSTLCALILNGVQQQTSNGLHDNWY